MDIEKPIVNKQIIIDLLFGDEEYVSEFAEASIVSFSEFKNNFQQALRMRDLLMLKKAGHKIKPVTQMMNLTPILEMYEKSKSILEDGTEASEKDLGELINNMKLYCDALLEELEELK